MTNALVGIDRPPGPISGSHQPPSTRRQTVAGERVEDEHRVVAGGVEASPGAVGDRDRRQMRPPSSRSSGPISIERAGAIGTGVASPRRRTTRSWPRSPSCSRLNGVWPLDHLQAVSPSCPSQVSSRSRNRQVFEGSGEAAHKETPAEAGVRLHAVPLSRRSLCRIWHLAANSRRLPGFTGPIPSTLSIRQHSSVVDQESTE